MSCISSGAKQVFSTLIDLHLKDVDPASDKGKVLKTLLTEIGRMPLCEYQMMPTGKRPLSKWQMCIKQERAGKKFDPAAIKDLAVKYRQGKCPS
jgi:hypothetical protein